MALKRAKDATTSAGGGDAAGPQAVVVAVEEGEGAGEVRRDGHGRGGVWQCGAAGWKGGDGNAGADTYGVAGGRGGGE
jgi:hypothetical protein